MKHYLAVLVPQPGGGWRAHFPDLPGCRAESSSVEGAILLAREAAGGLVRKLKLNGGAPAPRALEEIRADEAWTAERAIDWTKALVSVVAVDSLDS
jgi:predicted RNase H-like HicB family nuclease